MPYEPPSWLLETFRYMVNRCIDAGLEKGITSRYALVKEVYHDLRQLGFHSWYVLSAIEVATAILKNYRKAKRKGKDVKRPRAKKLMAKIGNQAIAVIGDRLRVPLRPRQYIYIPLHKRAMEFVRAGYRLRSVVLTPKTAYITFSKQVEVKEPKGFMAIDVNEDNITVATTDGEVMVFDLSDLKKASYGYFARRRAVQKRYHSDRRVLRKAMSKMKRNYQNGVSTRLHQVSACIVRLCQEKGYGIICENLRGLRDSVNVKVKRYNPIGRKVQLISRRSKEMKRRLNSWWFRRFLHMIEYKAAWEGVKVVKVNPRGTSSTCPECGFKLRIYPNGRVKCPRCGYKGDRHVTACLNMLKTSDVGLWFGPERPSSVAMTPALTNPSGGCGKAGGAKEGKLNSGAPPPFNTSRSTPRYSTEPDIPGGRMHAAFDAGRRGSLESPHTSLEVPGAR